MSLSGANLEKYRIPLDEILRVTRNFSSDTLIGDGGFGMVHRGELTRDGQKRTVAIKRLNRDGFQGNNEFHNELKMVSSFHHPNIITFIGYCDDANEMIIVSDYAKNGSLDHHLQKPDKMTSLTWAHRLRICLGAAQGLNYLHSGLGEHHRVIHRDVKSANILLDDNLEAKICDFGLSRFGARNQEDTQLLTRAAGTRFYMDPLYAERSRLRKESDIYSLGVVMFEMSSGTLVYHEKCFGDDDKPQYLIDVVRSYYDDGDKAATPKKLIDPIIRDHINIKSFHTFNKVAHECMSLKLKERPTMDMIIRKIEQALTIQLNHQVSLSTVTTRSLESFLIPLKEINLATQNFNHETRTGEYKYGAVHRGQFHGLSQNSSMAITRFSLDRYQGEHAFYKELRIVSNLYHKNVSRFIGYCDEANERIVVHELAVNRNVGDHLEYWKNNLPTLTWAQRLKVCIGAARGLEYLHFALGEDNEAIRGNISCRNILLDENMEAKISFFGLSKQGEIDRRHYEDQSELEKSDMFSFGVILFEMLSGYRAYRIDSKALNQRDLITVFQGYYHTNQLEQFIDFSITSQIDSRCLNIVKEVGYQCIMRDNESQWPWIDKDNRYPRSSFSMEKVIERLEDAAKFQVSPFV